MEYNNLIDQMTILDRQDLTPTEKLVAVSLLSFRNSETGRCNPPIYSEDQNKKTICLRTGYTKQCVIRTIASLEKKQIIICKKINARPSEIIFTINDDYRKQDLPSTTITATVNDDYRHGKPRLPITNKEQIRTDNTIRENSPSDDFSLEPTSEKEEQKIKPSKTLDCPYEEIANAYNEILGQYLGKCQKLTSTRKQNIKARWNDCIKDKDFDTLQGGIDCFREYFDYIKQCDFLIGKSGNFRASFDWIFIEGNYVKVCEGRYKNRPLSNNYQR